MSGGRIKCKILKCNYCGAIMRHLSIDTREIKIDVKEIKCPICTSSIKQLKVGG